ncbi:MAG: calcium-binding protein, partial [Phaeospirillum sp.]|nr:calcium-binding protein [Phaeospirillum sp.]
MYSISSITPNGGTFQYSGPQFASYGTVFQASVNEFGDDRTRFSLTAGYVRFGIGVQIGTNGVELSTTTVFAGIGRAASGGIGYASVYAGPELEISSGSLRLVESFSAGLQVGNSRLGATWSYNQTLIGGWLTQEPGNIGDWNDLVYPPLVLDLNGDGISLTSLDKSNVFIDIDKDGFKENTGWVKPDDGILVIDLGMDGKVTSADEFILTNWAPESTSDLEAARIAFDTNHDGKLDANDARWGEFKVWQDLNQDGVSDPGEMKTLSELGITEINLTGIPVVTDAGTVGPYDNIVSSIAQFTRADGSTGQVGDVGFLYSTYGWRQSTDGSGNIEINAEDGSKVWQLADGPAHVLDLGSNGLSGAVGASGNDTLSAGTAMDVLLGGGAGSDTLTGGAGMDWLVGGTGVDVLRGGAGHDVLFIDVEDMVIDGGDGYDVAFVADGRGMVLDLGSANLEAVTGNAGADHLFTTGTTGVNLEGGAGNDTLTGGAGDDALSGGAGADT